MSITKLKSYTTRQIREGEIPDHTYFFTNKKELLKLLEENKLMQFIELNNELYGYPKSEFEDLDKLIIVVAPSGTGKDSSFDFIETHYSNEIDKKIKYLFSVPSTVKIFVEYCEKNNIDYEIINLYVEDKERLRRIIEGDLYKLENFIDNLDNDNYGKVLKVIIVEDFKVYVLGMINFELTCFNDKKEVAEVIEKSINRFNRDNELFKVGIPKIEKYKNFSILDVNSLNVEKTAKIILDKIK